MLQASINGMLSKMCQTPPPAKGSKTLQGKDLKKGGCPSLGPGLASCAGHEVLLQGPGSATSATSVLHAVERHGDLGLLGLLARWCDLDQLHIGLLIRGLADGVLPGEDLRLDECPCREEDNREHDDTDPPGLPVLLAIDERGNEQGHHRHELQEDVQGRA